CKPGSPAASDTTMSDQSVSVGKTKGFTLPRAAVATIVPAGHQVTLAAGDRVTLLQALGATATVTTRDGEMARLSRQDSIDFGFIDAPDGSAVASDAPFSIDRVWEAATTVYDPEIPVDIVELGLVYRVDAEQLDGGGWHVDIDMSVTAPFCGMGDILRLDLRDAVAAVTGVDTVDVKLVFDPPWDASRLSDVARLELGMF
ncbi:iron-sulfur cluster assembly protein, partial [Ilumatobacter sp.]|uniref:iron-sulfur cluster assembly protein n=1 Tax=Ilumatobacter sp. TaxID=1967498 RepID=UPI003F6B6F03